MNLLSSFALNETCEPHSARSIVNDHDQAVGAGMRMSDPTQDKKNGATQPAPEQPDVEAIMAELRERVAERRRAQFYPEEPPALPPSAFVAMSPSLSSDPLDRLRAAAQLDLDGASHPAPEAPRLSLLTAIKKFFQYWRRKYSDPLFAPQTPLRAKIIAAAENLFIFRAWKKFHRYWTRKYTDPIFLNQSQFNTHVVGMIENLLARIEKLEAEVERLRAEQKPPTPPKEKSRSDDPPH
ncbi:MAG: hypothetical protein D6691_04505 [Candidatus Hydrogenedentota bacterium]|nr:MAG: hypothetical protein D6691_04505 [Candidatus Hydrogenedentota bacterium]